MAVRRTWIWVVVAGVGVIVLALVAVAVAGVYFVSRHMTLERPTAAEAFQSFDAVKASFGNAQPLFELDADERPRMLRPLSGLPTSSSRPEHLWILVWEPDEQRLIKMSLPLWMLRFGRGRMELGKGRRFELERLDLDVEELERIGPALLFDVRDGEGARVLLWTQ